MTRRLANFIVPKNGDKKMLTGIQQIHKKRLAYIILASASVISIVLIFGILIGIQMQNSYKSNSAEPPYLSNDSEAESKPGLMTNTKNEFTSKDTSAFTKTITVDGKQYQQINIPVFCKTSTDGYTVDATGYLKKDGKTVSTSLAFYGATNSYTKFGGLDCTTEATTVHYTLAKGYKIQPTLGGAYRYDRDDENQTISIYIDNLTIYADGSIGYAISNDHDYGKKIFFLSDEDQESEAYYIKLNTSIPNEYQEFLSNWKNKIDSYKPNSSYSSSSTNNSYKTDQKFEKYCSEVFPGNDIYNKSARESCIRSAKATYNLMTE